MSRVGKKPVEIVSGVDVAINGRDVTVKGGKGTLKMRLPEGVSASIADKKVTLTPANDEARALWGLARNNLQNMVTGVSQGFTVNLEINGVGYRAAVQGKTLNLSLGFSHPVNFPIPEGIEIKAPKPTELAISGIDKQKVGQVAAEIRSYRKPEPYKGKGVKYSTETVRRKEGKKK